ncbi:transposase [Halopseudomonas pachastrellae]|nr:transposase [Halopseudomonas pachastrellae]
MTVYLMKAELKALWSPDTAWGWRSAWKQWLRLADESAIPALQQFAKRLKGYWRGILSRGVGRCTRGSWKESTTGSR